MGRYTLFLIAALAVGLPVKAMDLTRSMEYDDDLEEFAVNATCPAPFVFVYDRCVHLDATVKGTWEEMRSFCQSYGGDLVIFTSVKFYFDSLQYMRATGTKLDYWIGGSDLGIEGQWVWVDGTPMVMGSPYWANYGCDNVLQPTGGTQQNCAILENYLHYYLNDLMCSYKANPFCEL